MSYSIPVFAQVDLIVVGGASGGVAAATAAARSGLKVFLAAAESYAGEDICATGRLWLDPSVQLESDLARAIYENSQGRRPVLFPAHVKSVLDDALVESGVEFLYGCSPASLLGDAEGELAGVIFTSRSGPFVVTARQVIDATPAALCARLAGLEFTPWPGDAMLEFSRVVIGPQLELKPDCKSPDSIPFQSRHLGDVTVSETGEPVTRTAWRYSISAPLPEMSPSSLAEIERELRAATWHPELVWHSERADWLPPDRIAGNPVAWTDAATVPPEAFQTGLAGLTVLGPCALLSRQDAAHLAVAPQAITIGERLGSSMLPGRKVILDECRPLKICLRDQHLCEPANHPRIFENRIVVEQGELPQLASVDIVVVGGGTGGAPAAIAAARAGASVLLLEAQHDLGGVGTVGSIATYYHGNRDGFTSEITAGLYEIGGKDEAFMQHRWNAMHKSEWFRREIEAAGGKIWYQTTVSGVIKEDNKLTGVLANSPWGRGVIRARVVIDATGNSDVAAAAGAACLVVSESDLAIQGSGLTARPFIPVTINSDYTFIDDCDLLDTTRSFVIARRRFRDHFEIGPIVNTRERRQIVGDVTVAPVNVYAGHTWSDAICLSRSNFDSHGFTVDPIFRVLPPDRVSLDAWLPLRALLPRGLSGILVTGLGLSAHRDVMPVLRMQPDIQNHAYAAGLAAFMALSHKSEIRRISIPELQRELVARQILPQTAMLHGDSGGLPHSVLRSAAAGNLAIHAEVAALINEPEASRLLLRQHFASERDPELRLRCARLLAVIGDTTGADFLVETLEQNSWDEGWNYRGMGQFGRSTSLLDDIILLLALSRVGKAKAAVLRKMAQLDGDAALSHIRAVAVYCETFPDADCAEALFRLLSLPALSNHAFTTLREELDNIPESTVDNTTRNNALRELYLARALIRCGDHEGLARRRLAQYAADIRAHFSRHANLLLQENL